MRTIRDGQTTRRSGGGRAGVRRGGPLVEVLEDRRMMSAGPLVVAGILTVAGTAGGDVITVAPGRGANAGRVLVGVNARQYAFAKAGLKGIAIDAKSGNDFVGVDPTAGALGLPVTMIGGAGNDTLLGGERNDRIDGGAGSNVLMGRGGNDTIFGGSGVDYIDGGVGKDVVVGGGNRDTVVVAAGRDKVTVARSASVVKVAQSGPATNAPWDRVAQQPVVQQQPTTPTTPTQQPTGPDSQTNTTPPTTTPITQTPDTTTPPPAVDPQDTPIDTTTNQQEQQQPPTTPTTQPQPVKAFPVYDGLLYGGKPDMTQFGFQKIMIVYGVEENWGDESFVRTAARRAAAAGQIMVLDVECWSVDARQLSADALAANLAKLARIVSWVRDEAPTVKFGFYGFQTSLGVDMQAAELNPAVLDDWRKAQDALSGLISTVDYIFPCVYTNFADPNYWRLAVETELKQMATYGKPVVPFAMMQYDLFAGSLQYQDVSPQYWRLMVETCRRYADGMVAWGGYQKTWSDTAPWFSEMKRDMAETSGALVAPANLTAGSGTTVSLSWDDRSDNEAAFVVERSTDGQNFSNIGTTLEDQHTFVDTTALSGVTYTYRVRAVNGYAESDYTNAVQASGMRSALGTIVATNYDATVGGVPHADFLAGLNNGTWVKYSLDFGTTGATTFTANIGVDAAHAGQIIELHVDDVNGPLLGSLQVADTGWWTTYVDQSVTITATKGAHDVYLVVKGTNGAGYLHSIRFE